VLTGIVQDDHYRTSIRELLRRESADYRVVKLARHQHVYMCGDRDSNVYLIESGQVKMVAPSPDGKECVIAVYAPGDFFGERSLCGQAVRSDTAMTMRNTTLRQVPSSHLLAVLQREAPLGAFVQYLVERIVEKEEMIASLLTAKSEQRLAMTLLRLSRRLGKQESCSTRIEHRFSQEELAEMVGTTRSRIGLFLKRFRSQGLIELNEKRHLLIRESKLEEYLERMAFAEQMGQGVARSFHPDSHQNWPSEA
jgi:CRP/FNR family cyclic AMP-dependent transcriptional regulator